MPKPLILVTNDDGIVAPGIRALVEIASQFGEVVVIAPDKPQSGQGHAITLNNPIRLRPVDLFEGIEAYECTGTPVDCVKLAKHVVLKERNIDLCLSGINHGSNASINIIYSGTMSAAMEASLEGIDSIGFSLLDLSFEADFSASKHFGKQIVEKVLRHKLSGTKLLNVNIPLGSVEEIKGVKICKQGDGTWVEEFKEGIDPRGQKYYWLTGHFINQDIHPDADISRLEQKYISVVPSGHDLTIYSSMSKLKYLEEAHS